MPNFFSESKVTDFLNFMKLPDGTSVVSDDLMEYLMAYGFFTAPASTKYHGNYEGGLLEHSYMVTKYLLTLTQDNHLIWRKSRSPYIVGMFHDLCKIDQYRHPVTGHIEEFNGGCTPIYDEQAWEYNPNTLLKGHGDKSVMLLSQFYTLTDEEVLSDWYATQTTRHHVAQHWCATAQRIGDGAQLQSVQAQRPICLRPRFCPARRHGVSDTSLDCTGMALWRHGERNTHRHRDDRACIYRLHWSWR